MRARSRWQPFLNSPDQRHQAVEASVEGRQKPILHAFDLPQDGVVGETQPRVPARLERVPRAGERGFVDS